MSAPEIVPKFEYNEQSAQGFLANRGGAGGLPEFLGIKIVDVTGASNGVFTLNGDYLFQGEQAVIAEARRRFAVFLANPDDPRNLPAAIRQPVIKVGVPNTDGAPVP